MIDFIAAGSGFVMALCIVLFVVVLIPTWIREDDDEP